MPYTEIKIVRNIFSDSNLYAVLLYAIKKVSWHGRWGILGVIYIHMVQHHIKDPF